VQEVLLDDQGILQAVGVFLHDPSLATAYLAFGRQGLRRKWLEQELSEFSNNSFPTKFPHVSNGVISPCELFLANVSFVNF